MVLCFAACCNHQTIRDQCSFFRFPKDKTLKALWRNRSRRADREPNEESRLCSCHFKDGKRENNPTIFSYLENKKFDFPSPEERVWKKLKPTVLQKSTNGLQKNSLQKKDSMKKLNKQDDRNMEYISCCIPRCKSKSFRNIENNSATRKENVLMFPVPRNYMLFKKWMDALKGTGIKISKRDHICEQHFLENDIDRYHRTQTPDGDIIEIKKQLPVLKDDAVPVKFLTPSFHVVENSSEKTSDSKSLVVSNSESHPANKLSFAVNSCDSENNGVSLEIEMSEDSCFENCSESSVSRIQEGSSCDKKHISYNDLVKNIQLVKRPSMFWSTLCTDQFIIFARWSNKFIAEKRIVIESSLTVRVFLKDWEIEMTDLMDITSTNDISSLLEKVDNYKFDLNC